MRTGTPRKPVIGGCPGGNPAEAGGADRSASRSGTGSLISLKLAKALSLLPERNARILRLHFGLEGGHEHTLEEIGALLGVTRERVRQLRDRALRRIREGEMARELGDLAGAKTITVHPSVSVVVLRPLPVRRRRAARLPRLLDGILQRAAAS